MFKLFKKSPPNDVNNNTSQSDSLLKIKTINKAIEEIHETFYTEVDKLLASAKIANSLDTNKQHLIEKCARLKSLGFNNTKEVKEAEIEIARLNELKRDNEAKKMLIEAINYFSFKYPNYKFITEKSVEKICAKYNLVYGAIDRYIGTVPDKNLKHIEDFKVLQDDECYIHEEEYVDMYLAYTIRVEKKYITYKEYMADKECKGYKFDSDVKTHIRKRTVNTKCPLEIVAPLNDFNMQGMEIKDYNISNIEIPDPIVLKPVIYNNQKHYLIVTAWGLEATDELVLNEKHN